jgi:hypothetical protein
MVKKFPRPRRPSRERGTTLFVVVLAITMLTGIGLYTVHSSALLARAAGNEREASQTEFLAQLGTVAALSQLSLGAAAYVPQARSGSDDCRNNLGLDLTKIAPPSCLELASSKDYTLSTGHGLFETDSFGTATVGSTSTPAISGAFHTEVTDLAPAGSVPGMDVGQKGAFQYWEAKLTTTATLQPAAASAACVQNVMQVTGQHITRAHVIVGPVPGQ